MRYFHEDLPELHVIAAGSLVEFALEEIGIPVGRVSSLYMYPMSFLEFSVAKGQSAVIPTLITHDPSSSLTDAVHSKLLSDVGEYLAVGGMPEAVRAWVDHADLPRCASVRRRLLDTYRQDFARYSRRHQIKYVDLLFNEVPRFLGRKVVFSHLTGGWRRRDLQPGLDLLSKAGIAHLVRHTSASGLPLGAGADPERFKVLFLDVGLAQSILGFDGAPWILDPASAFANDGALAESFVGQELIAYGNPETSPELYYWHREERASNAEVDYVLPMGGLIIPVEVKSGAGGWLRSLRLYLQRHREISPYGIRVSTQNFSVITDLQSYPLYAVGLLAARCNPATRARLGSLAADD